MTVRLAAVVLLLVGCGVDVDLRGRPRRPEPAWAIVGAPRALDDDRVPLVGTTAACIEDVCLVPAVGLVSSRDGARLGGSGLDGQVAADGRRFVVADGGALLGVGLDGETTTIAGGAHCTHVAWTGTTIVARCDGASVWLDGDRVVAGAGDPFADPGASWLGLVGTGRGALALGVRAAGSDGLGSVLVVALDEHGRRAGGVREIARTPFASEARAVGMGRRVTVAWPAFAPFPRLVSHYTVLDAGGGEIAPPQPLLPRAAPGPVTSDGHTWLHGWRDSDGTVRVLRVDADGERVADRVAADGIDVGSFPMVSAVGLEGGPFLLFGTAQQRVLRFVPLSDETRR